MATSHNIHLSACMTPAQAQDFGRSNWWIRDQGRGEFLDLNYPTATRGLSLTLHPGHYLIGAGPVDHYRNEVWIATDGTQTSTRETGTQMAPCIVHGCTGVVGYDAVSPPPSCDAAELDPPRARKCGGCQEVTR